MLQKNWDLFSSDAEIIQHLKTLPRYKNNAVKSLIRRASFFLSLLFCKLTGKEKPLFVVLVTNNDCNLDCSYCYGEYGKRSAKDNYSTKKLLQMIDELKSLGCKLLTVHGGETLLRKDIGEILNYCKLQKFYISLNTNGYLVPRRIEELMCVDTIIFSLDGGEKSNDRNRGKGSYQKVMEGIDVTLQRKIPTVISATLTSDSETAGELEFLAKLGKEKGIRIQYSLLYNHDKLADQDSPRDMTLSDNRTRNLIQRIKNLKHEGYPIYYADKVLDSAIEWPAHYEEKRTISKSDRATLPKKNMIPCYHGKLKYQIDADGRVVRCWAWDKKDAPNIKTAGIKSALKACNTDDDCQHCVFLANNEHNAMMDLNLKSVAHIAAIQIADALKMGARIGKKIKPSTAASLTAKPASKMENVAPGKTENFHLPPVDSGITKEGCKKV